MKINILILVAFVTISFTTIAVLTNPNEDKHRQVIKSKLSSFIKPESVSQTDKYGLANVLITPFANAMVSGLLSSMTTDNYILFSTTKLELKGEAKIISIGAFGKIVTVFDEGSTKNLLNR